MSDVNAVLAAFGEKESMEGRTVVPESYYPCTIYTPEGVQPSAKKGTAGLQLAVQINEGPFAGQELGGMDMTIWLSPKMMDLLAHFTKQVTGKTPDPSVFDAFGFVPSSMDRDTLKEELVALFDELSPEDRCSFMGQFIRAEEWNGKKVIVKLGLEENTFTNDKGEEITFDKNRIVSFYNLKHEKYGLPKVRQIHLPQQEAATSGGN